MAVLSRSLFALSILININGAYASIPRVDPIRMGALDALKRCDRSRASFWAKELEGLDPDQAILYRLAWLETPAPVLSHSKLNSSSEAWAWKRNNEIWADEYSLSGESCGRSSDEERVINFSSLPAAVVEAQLKPAISRYPTARPALREVLRKFALFEWLNGRKLTLPSDKLSANASSAEKCEWRALQALHSDREDSKTLSELAAGCTSPNNLLWTIVKMRAGDLLLKEGQGQAAFAAFQSVVDLMPERKLPKALAYRIAVSGILSGAPDDLIFRAAYKAISPEDEGEEVLPPALQSGLANLVCEKVGETRATSLITTLRRVFSSGSLIPVTLRLTEACSESKLGPLWVSLLNEARRPQDRGRVLGRLLSSSIARNDAAARIRAVSQIAELSRTFPYLARHEFWSALKRSQSERAAVAIQDVVSRYRKRASWQSADELRLKHLMKNDQNAAQKDEGILQVNAAESKSAIKLPMAVLVEPLAIKGEIRSGFTALLEQDLRR